MTNLKAPAGLPPVAGTSAEPYTKTGWAREVVEPQSGMVLVYVPAGKFTMGSPTDEVGRRSDEMQHLVNLSQGFYLGRCAVTQAQWEVGMGNNPSQFKHAGRDAPVEQVSWDDCQAFCRKLGAGFRLPTEAEWEYACRAGSKKAYCFGADPERLGDYGWYSQNSNHTTHPVGQKKPNDNGLYDMHGNVWEWCHDFCGSYPAGSATNPTGPVNGQGRVLRGGSWYYHARLCHSAMRFRLEPGNRINDLGCRVALTLPPEP